ncbi:hypothetical protein Hypma_013766 [Hypsizygus marmoreus]|uniref:Uncharacterized protein n=1 Tax=Hypsizygus marmoreus TaxID=39966 RepID=A0A369K792_HYPMA|nr:hypothetical protein Hypma_013766 [Hypsizygus marmoreus]
MGEMNGLQAIQSLQPCWWSYRPLHPTKHTFNLFSKAQDYDFAVDTLTVERYLRDQVWDEKAEIIRTLADADDSYMGAWVNSASQKWVTWLIRQRIPCFIIHAFTKEELDPYPDIPRLPNFFVYSEATLLEGATNRYEESHRDERM